MKRITGLKSHLNIGELFTDIGIAYKQESRVNQLHWSDNVAYEMTIDEIEYLENIANNLFQICLSAIETEITQGNFSDYNFSPIQQEIIKQDWKNKKEFCYGYFDFISDGEKLKLQKCNFESPQFLVESSLLQWKCLEKAKPHQEQYNSIHEALLYHCNSLKKEKKDIYLLDEINYQSSYFKDILEISGYNIQYKSVKQILSGWSENSPNIAILNPQWFEYRELLETSSITSNFLFEPAWCKLLSHPTFLKKLTQKDNFNTNIHIKYLTHNQIDISPILSIWIIGNSSYGISIKEQRINQGKIQYNVVPHYFLDL